MNNRELYLFKFVNIDDFFLKMGLEIIIELSETIKKKLTETFSTDSSIFRFSFSEFIVILSGSFTNDNKLSDINNLNIVDFDFKGMTLHYMCKRIPFSDNQSVYDIFENIYLLINN